MLLVIGIGGLLTYYLSGKALKPLNTLNGQGTRKNVRDYQSPLFKLQTNADQ
jgi:hypothetical protein